MNEQVMSNGNESEQLHIPVVVRSVSEIEERLRMAIGGMEHARECGNEQVRKDYQKDVSCLFWVLGQEGGGYHYSDGVVTLYY